MWGKPRFFGVGEALETGGGRSESCGRKGEVYLGF